MFIGVFYLAMVREQSSQSCPKAVSTKMLLMHLARAISIIQHGNFT